MVRTRTDAAKLTEAGFVRLNGTRLTAPGHACEVGDVVTLALDRSGAGGRGSRVLRAARGRRRRPRALSES